MEWSYGHFDSDGQFTSSTSSMQLPTVTTNDDEPTFAFDDEPTVTYMMLHPRHPFPPSPPPPPNSMAPYTPCSPTQPCPATPSQSSNSPTPLTTPPHRRNIQPLTNQAIKEYGFDLNEHWHQDSEFYDNQKLNGLNFLVRSRPPLSPRNWTLKVVTHSSYQWRLCSTNSTITTGCRNSPGEGKST